MRIKSGETSYHTKTSKHTARKKIIRSKEQTKMNRIVVKVNKQHDEASAKTKHRQAIIVQK